MSDHLITLLREVAANFQSRLSEMTAIEELKLAPFQARLLSVISRSPGIAQITLAAAMDRDKAQVARAIKELESRGYIMRSVHESDWRIQCLSLTDAGKQASALIEAQRGELVTKALRECSAKEQAALCHTLEKIRRAMS